MRRLVAKLWRYASVSAIATSTSLTVLALLVWTGAATPGWANVVATAVGTVPSFELNRRWVWGTTGRRSLRAEIGPFWALSFAELGLSTLAVSTAASWVSSAGLGVAARTAVAMGANVAVFGSLWVVQYVILDRVLFASHGDRGGERPGDAGEPGAASTAAMGGVAAAAAGGVAAAAAGDRWAGNEMDAVLSPAA